MAYIDEDALRAIQKDYDSDFRMHRPTGAPPPMENEPPTAYRRRLAEDLQQHAPNCKDFNIRHSTGTAFDTLERQIKADAQREAHNPTEIPPGELREVVKIDDSGRRIKEFFGSPSAWLDIFAGERKRLVGIYAPGYNANMTRLAVVAKDRSATVPWDSLRRDNQDENRATIRMRMRRRGGDEGRA